MQKKYIAKNTLFSENLVLVNITALQNNLIKKTNSHIGLVMPGFLQFPQNRQGSLMCDNR